MIRTRRLAPSLLSTLACLAAALPASAQTAPGPPPAQGGAAGPVSPPATQAPSPRAGLEEAPRGNRPASNANELPGPNPLPQSVPPPPPRPAAPAPTSTLPPPDRLWNQAGERFASPQSFALELRLGPYRPEIDERVAGTPFLDFFGRDDRYLLGLELDWQIARVPLLGTVGVGAGWSYTSRSGPNQLADGQPEDEGALVDQESKLALMPMHAVGVLRVDAPARAWGVPFVPYGKFGLGYTLWWINDGRGTATNEYGIAGKDASTGTFVALGGMLLLDTFDRSSARQLDAETGINNTYLFLEWARSKVGGGEQMFVGSTDWVAGLALEL